MKRYLRAGFGAVALFAGCVLLTSSSAYLRGDPGGGACPDEAASSATTDCHTGVLICAGQPQTKRL